MRVSGSNEPGAICTDSAIWFLAFVGALLVLKLADDTFGLDPRAYAAGCLLILLAVTYRTWRQTEQGNHPVFLFMLFLILFQYGRVVSWAIFGVWSISHFNLTVPTPFTIPPADLKRSLFLMPLSASFVYIGFFYRKGRRVYGFTENTDMRKFFGWLYVLTIPFVVYKSGSYLYYALHHGGYVAMYLHNGAVFKKVGLVVRAIALLNTMAFILYLIVEQRKNRLKLAIFVFDAILLLELLVGYRGEFFEYVIFLWMVYNIKTNSSFKPMTGLVASVIFIFAAVGAEIFRRTNGVIKVNLVEYMLAGQGVSFDVTASAVMFYARFHPHVWAYLFNQFFLPYKLLSQFPKGSLFTLDLTAFLNPHIVNYALGTGEAYVAHLYLIYGIPTVCAGSVIIGLLCRGLTAARSMFARAMSFAIFLWIPYMPRAGYLEAVATSSKFLIVALMAFGLYSGYVWLRHCMQFGEPRRIAVRRG